MFFMFLLAVGGQLTPGGKCLSAEHALRLAPHRSSDPHRPHLEHSFRFNMQKPLFVKSFLSLPIIAVVV